MKKGFLKLAVLAAVLCAVGGGYGSALEQYNKNVIVKPTYNSTGSLVEISVTNKVTDDIYSANVYGDNNTVMGMGNHIGETIDTSTYYTDYNSVFGFKNYLTPHNLSGYSQIFGSRNYVGSSSSTVIGDNNNVAYENYKPKTDKTGGYKYNIAIGNSITMNGGSYGIGIGYSTKVSADYGTAIGYLAQANGKGSTAIGYNAYTDSTQGTASLGNNTWMTTVSFGKNTGSGNTYFARLKNLYDGAENHDAATYGQIIKNKEYTFDSKTGIATIETNAGQTAFTLKLSSNGAVEKNNTGLVTGGAVYDAIEKEMSGKAAYTAGDHISLTNDKISVVTDGEIESGDTGIVTGGAVYEKTGDTSKLKEAGLSDNLTDSILDVNEKVDNVSEQVVDVVNNSLDSLRNDVNKVGAGAAALAALHPETFNPDDKWSFAVGYGHYKNANSGAFGAFYKPNADTTVSAGSTIGNGNPMMNLGVSFKLGARGKGMSIYSSNAELVREMNVIRKDNEMLRQANTDQAKKIASLETQMAQILKKLGLSKFERKERNL